MSQLFVVRVAAVQMALFLLNESVVIFVAAPAYGLLRVAAIPLLSIVVVIAGISHLAQAKAQPRGLALTAGAIVGSLLVCGFQWFWPRALFGWLMDRVR